MLIPMHRLNLTVVPKDPRESDDGDVLAGDVNGPHVGGAVVGSVGRQTAWTPGRGQRRHVALASLLV